MNIMASTTTSTEFTNLSTPEQILSFVLNIDDNRFEKPTTSSTDIRLTRIHNSRTIDKIKDQLEIQFNFGKLADEKLYADFSRILLDWKQRFHHHQKESPTSKGGDWIRFAGLKTNECEESDCSASNNYQKNCNTTKTSYDSTHLDDDSDGGYMSANDSSEIDNENVIDDLNDMHIDDDKKNAAYAKKHAATNNQQHDILSNNLMKEFELMGRSPSPKSFDKENKKGEGKENKEPFFASPKKFKFQGGFPTDTSVTSTATPTPTTIPGITTKQDTRKFSPCFQKKFNIFETKSKDDGMTNSQQQHYAPSTASTSLPKQEVKGSSFHNPINLEEDTPFRHQSSTATSSSSPFMFPNQNLPPTGTTSTEGSFQFNVNLKSNKSPLNKRGSPRGRRSKFSKSLKKQSFVWGGHVENTAGIGNNDFTSNANKATAATEPVKNPFSSPNFNSNHSTPIGVDTPDTMDIDTPVCPSNNSSTMDTVTPTFNIGLGGSAPSTKKNLLHSQSFRRSRQNVKVKSATSTPNNSILRNQSKMIPPSVNNNDSQPQQYDVIVDKKDSIQNRLDEEKKQKMETAMTMKASAKTLYANEQYTQSVLKFTEAIVFFTNNFTIIPDPQKRPEESEFLANLYWSRSAGLMMVGAYDAATNDCEQGIKHLRDYNPLAFNAGDEQSLNTYLRSDGGLTLMSKLSSRMCRAHMKLGNVVEAERAISNTIRIANIATMCHEKILAYACQNGISIPVELQQLSEKVLIQCKADAELHRSDLKTLKDNFESINAAGGLCMETETQYARNKSRQLFHIVENILKIAPANIAMQEGKVLCLATLRRWTKLSSYCDSIACQNATSGGVYTADLTKMDAFPGIVPTGKLPKALFHETLTAEQIGEAALWMPRKKILPLYMRALRINEQYLEAQTACNALASLPQSNEPIWSPDRSREKKWILWLEKEQENLKLTMRQKEEGDVHYRNGNYKKAAEVYASVLLIDTDINISLLQPWEYVTAGGRLNAVLHCNRAACLMALGNFEDASKECTAALKIYKKYMKAMLRRARCYIRLQSYDEAISEYNSWFALVNDARSNPNLSIDDECPFDRASDVKDDDYEKVMTELNDVKNKKATKEANERQEAENARRRASSAFNRRQTWYEQQETGGPRRWDSFNGFSPNKKDAHRSTSARSSSNFHSKRGNDGSGNKKTGSYYSRQKNPEPERPSPGSSAVTCHYAVLQVTTTASDADIKKAFKKMALKYHPDKNKDESATETFRKVRLAYETLNDERSRRLYDSERLRRFRR